MGDRLSDRCALVTGAAQNIGRAIAERFAAEGAAVALVDRQAEALEAVRAGIETAGGRAVTIEVDLTERGAVADMVEEAVRLLGGLDVLVNNAYAGPYRSLTEQDDEGWDRAIAIGIDAVMIACRSAIPHLQQRGGGSIINLGSMNSFTPACAMAAYSAVKGAVVNFSRQVAVEYGESGVRCNALCPGFITHAQREAGFEQRPLERKRVEATIPLRRVGTSEEVANAALFLASDESSFVTGHSLVVDGGATVQNGRMVTYPFEQALRAESG